MQKTAARIKHLRPGAMRGSYQNRESFLSSTSGVEFMAGWVPTANEYATNEYATFFLEEQQSHLLLRVGRGAGRAFKVGLF